MLIVKSFSRSFPAREHAFTLIELMVVLTMIALLASLAAPVVYKSVQRSKEAALKETLQVSRIALDDFYTDKGRYPESLRELVDEQYLRSQPYDPVLERADAWDLEQSQYAEGIVDLASSADGRALDGSLYSEW